jgi:hypothetical protein
VFATCRTQKPSCIEIRQTFLVLTPPWPISNRKLRARVPVAKRKTPPERGKLLSSLWKQWLCPLTISCVGLYRYRIINFPQALSGINPMPKQTAL